MGIEMVDVTFLKHIEGFSKKRVQWLKDKIVREGVWNKPVALDVSHGLVLDGQHRISCRAVPRGRAHRGPQLRA